MFTVDVCGDDCDRTEKYVSDFNRDANTISINDEWDLYTLEITTLSATTLIIKHTEDKTVHIKIYTKQ